MIYNGDNTSVAVNGGTEQNFILDQYKKQVLDPTFLTITDFDEAL